MKTFLLVFCFLSLLLVSFSAKPKSKKVARQTVSTPSTTTVPTEEAKEPTINWGKCPQLEPKEEDKNKKQKILQECLKEHPIPKNLTEESVAKHQKSIAECALKKEEWFSKSGSYRFKKAETEIKAKKLSSSEEKKLLAHHKQCESEAKKEFPDKSHVVDQVQLYQACVRA